METCSMDQYRIRSRYRTYLILPLRSLYYYIFIFEEKAIRLSFRDPSHRFLRPKSHQKHTYSLFL